MIPTCYLRQVRYWVTHNGGHAEQRTVQETKLQQWWRKFGVDESARPIIGYNDFEKNGNTRPVYGDVPEGEWRDVPIEGEQ